MTDVLELNRSGGTLIQRDNETLIASGCAQVSSHQILLLTGMHPRVHFSLCPDETSGRRKDADGLIVVAITMPPGRLLLSGDAMQIFLAGVVFCFSLVSAAAPAAPAGSLG